MATWGAYFTSYVKKTDQAAPAATAEVKTDGRKDGDKGVVTPAKVASAATQVNPVFLAPVTTKPAISTSSAANDRFKCSNSTGKKLYEIPTVVPKVPNQVQRSTSNTARIAKLFGYSGTASVPPAAARVDPPKSRIGYVVAMAQKAKEDENEEKSENMAGLPPDLFASAMVVTPVGGDEPKFDGLEGEVELPAVWPLSTGAIEPIAARRSEEILGLGLEAKPVKKADENRRIEASAMPLASAPLFQSSKQGKIAEKASVDLKTRSAAAVILNRPVQNAISKRKPSPSSKRNDSLGMLDFFANQAGTATANPVQEPPKTNPFDMLDFFASQADNTLVDSVQEPPNKRSPLDMLDFFASQADGASMTAPIHEPPKKANPLEMFDFFASQAENKIPIQEPKQIKGAEQKTRFERGERVPPSPRRNKASLELLDFFANQAMSTISEDKPLTQIVARKIEPIAPMVKNEPVMVQRVLEQVAVAGKMEEPPALVTLAKKQEAVLLPEPLTSAKAREAVPLPVAKEAQPSKPFLGSIFAFPSKKEAPTPASTATPGIASPNEEAPSQNDTKPFIFPMKQEGTLQIAPTQAPKPKVPQTDSKPFTFPQQQMAALAPACAPELARNRFSSTRSSISSAKSSLFSPQHSFPRSSATSFELRSIMDVRETEVMEVAVDFRERFITYEKQAEQIRLEKEEMELERERMEKQLMDIKREAHRIAEEEAAMKKFVESLEVERERDAANEDRKRRTREARDLANRLERERIIREEVDRERANREGREEEQQKLRADVAERNRRNAEQEQRKQDEEEQLGMQRLEDDRRTQQKKRAARERAERQWYEDEAAEDERRTAVEEEARYAGQERRAAAERDRRIAAEENSRGRQPRRRDFVPESVVASEDEESEDEIVKAERKIQEAFAALAKERGQQAPVPGPIKRMNTTPIKTQRGPSNRAGGEGPRVQRDEADRGFGRNITVGARPQRRPEVAPAPVARAGTMRARPQIRGGLPSGPKLRPADI